MTQETYLPFKEWDWKSYDGSKKIDLIPWLEKYSDRVFYIGTDSQNTKSVKRGKCTFTTAVIAYKMGVGGVIAIHTDKTPYMASLRQKLLMEAMRSLECAWFVNDHIPEASSICIHLDVNDKLEFKSSNYKDELISLILAQGFQVKHKPNSWASSTVADKRTK